MIIVPCILFLFRDSIFFCTDLYADPGLYGSRSIERFHQPFVCRPLLIQLAGTALDSGYDTQHT